MNKWVLYFLIFSIIPIYWCFAFSLCKKYLGYQSFLEFLITKNYETNKFLWGIIFNSYSIKGIPKNLAWYIVKYGHFIFLILLILLNTN